MGIRVRNGEWHFRLTVNGHEYTGNLNLAGTERNRNKALTECEKIRQQILAGRSNDLRISPVAFSKAADAFSAWYQAEHMDKPGTWKRADSSLTSLRVQFGNRPVHQITTGMIEDYKTKRRMVDRVKPISLRHDLQYLSQLLKFARSHKWIVSDPMEGVKKPSDRGAVRMNILSPEAEVEYFKAAREIKKNQNLFRVAKLMLNQGFRPTEVMSLAWRHVDLMEGTIRVVDGKTPAARRTLVMTTESRQILAAARAELPDDYPWVFPGRPATKHLTTVQRSHEWCLRRMNGLPPHAPLEDTKFAPFVVYDLRHTFATRIAASNTCSISVIASILGHADLRSVFKYIHHVYGDLAAAMRAWDAYLKANPSIQVGPLAVEHFDGGPLA